MVPPRKIIEEKISKWAGVIKSAEAPQVTPQVLYDAQCAVCGRWTKVIFPPDGKRPIYCKSCLKKTEKERAPVAEETIKETATPTVSLEEAAKTDYNPPTAPKEKIGIISFSPSKKVKTEKEPIKRKEVNVEELKKTLEEALKKQAK